jgi:hypothetical protein
MIYSMKIWLALLAVNSLGQLDKESVLLLWHHFSNVIALAKEAYPDSLTFHTTRHVHNEW